MARLVLYRMELTIAPFRATSTYFQFLSNVMGGTQQDQNKRGLRLRAGRANNFFRRVCVAPNVIPFCSENRDRLRRALRERPRLRYRGRPDQQHRGLDRRAGVAFGTWHRDKGGSRCGLRLGRGKGPLRQIVGRRLVANVEERVRHCDQAKATQALRPEAAINYVVSTSSIS
jgi:hypothetical protein